jgi:glycosyltransferase involved in cell wall biosynthesis
MQVSTLMTAHNGESYIAQALDSVLTQTRGSDEVIVIDDGSTDKTPEILRSHLNQIRVIRQGNMGPARALNVAIAAAKGDALAFLDCDDLWMPEKLRLQCGALSADKELEAVFGFMAQFASPDLEPEAARQFILPECLACVGECCQRWSHYDAIIWGIQAGA